MSTHEPTKQTDTAQLETCEWLATHGCSFVTLLLFATEPFYIEHCRLLIDKKDTMAFLLLATPI